jgi:hypothetical protein
LESLIGFAAFANLPIQIKPKVALVATGFTVLRQSFHLPHGNSKIKPKVALVATGFTVLRQSFHLPHGS